jgi:hypothetical protein
MTEYIIRIVLYTVLPVATAAIVIAADPRISTPAARREIYLIYLFGLGVAGAGIGNAFGHIFLSDVVAGAIGWEAGSPFQLEMGFANLALGVLGFVAVSRRDGFREATVIAVTVVGVGATIVHIVDIVQTGNLAPGNTWQNAINLAKPALLIAFLRASRRSDADGAPGTKLRIPHLKGVGFMTGAAAGGFGAGFAIGWPAIGTAAGIVAGAVAVAVTLRASLGAR